MTQRRLTERAAPCRKPGARSQSFLPEVEPIKNDWAFQENTLEQLQIPTSGLPRACDASHSRMLTKPAIHTSLDQGCPETPLLPGSQVTDSVRAEFAVLDAHKELFVGNRGRASRTSLHFSDYRVNQDLGSDTFVLNYFDFCFSGARMTICPCSWPFGVG